MADASEQSGGIPVTLFLDYSCPFCYVASHRLERLARRYPLDILWRFLEARPETPADGAAVSTDDARGERGEVVRAMVRDDGLPWSPPPQRSNSRRALLLAQAVQLHRRHRFLPLHRALFHAHFGDGRDLGDASVLRAIAGEQGVADLVDTAWNTAQPVEVFLSHVEAASELGITSIPSLVVSGRVFSGASSMELLEQSLVHHAENSQGL